CGWPDNLKSGVEAFDPTSSQQHFPGATGPIVADDQAGAAFTTRPWSESDADGALAVCADGHAGTRVGFGEVTRGVARDRDAPDRQARRFRIDDVDGVGGAG